MSEDGFSPDLLLLVQTSPTRDGLGDYGPALEHEGCAQTPLPAAAARSHCSLFTLQVSGQAWLVPRDLFQMGT